MNWGRYRKAFLWCDRKSADEASAYRLPIADVIEGKLVAIPRAVFAAAAVIQAGRGGELGSDEVDVKASIGRYCEKMAAQFRDDSIVVPWNKKSIDALLVDARSIGVYDMTHVRDAAREFFSVLKPEDRKQLLAELSAGPSASSPTETSDSEELKALRTRALRVRSQLAR